jgi:hypothetical protein
MDKRKQKKIKRRGSVYRKPAPACPNCGKPGPHFVPPSFGNGGFYLCTKFPQPEV